MPIFDDIETILFCDESKFSKKDGNAEDAIYYFGVAAEKKTIKQLNQEFNTIIANANIQASVFHAKKIFREKHNRQQLMIEICDLIIRHRLNCFCFKYLKPLLFEPTKILSHFNDSDIINFNNPEFQALFYFVSRLNTELRDIKPNLLKSKILMFFDSNVYGRKDTEEFDFRDKDFVIKRMSFVSSDKIGLLALPDFFGYIFRKSKISLNKAQSGDMSLETSKLTINSYLSIHRLSNAGLFRFLDIDKWIDSVNNIRP